uniref:G-protein coupled receptors family 1 profile domain-containing protein n=1 Tax=Knipowitschia caucasica TaxID=637954 RepID=A0AAV2K1A3_KNICA
MSPSEDSHLEVVLQRVSVVLYILTVILGICGNAVVIYLAAFKIQTKVTHVFLVNLAVTDLIFCFSRILSIVYKLRSNDWPFGTFLCKLNGFIKYTNMFCSVFLLAVISLDRALCVLRPFLIKTKRTLRVVRVVALCVWTLAVAQSIPFYIHRHLHLDKNNRTLCSVSKDKEKDRKLHLYLLRFVCGFLLPFLVILGGGLGKGPKASLLRIYRRAMAKTSQTR